MATFSIPSEKHSTVSSLKSLFEFLSDFKNFKSILPEDKVEDFKFETNQCSFTIKGVTALTVKLVERHPYSYILYTSEGLGKFNFNLKVFFDGEAGQTGICHVDLSGDMNPFILSMAQKPLQALVNTMSLKLSQLELMDKVNS